MNKEETAIQLLSKLMENSPNSYLYHINIADKGIHFILRYLAENQDREVNAGELAKKLGVTTGRVAILLKKIQERDLIVKYSSSEDARVTIVQLTAKGKQAMEEHKQAVITEMMNIIDDVGIEEMETFIRIGKKIKHSFESRPKTFKREECEDNE